MPDLAHGIALRGATPADAAAIAAVQAASWRTTYGGILPAAVIERETGRKTEAMWRQWLAPRQGGVATIVAERAGEGVVGFINCGPARRPIEGLEAEVYALYVLREHQRVGVGRELVRASARHFVRQGLFGFYLWVLKANAAQLFYEALGGERVAEKTEDLGGHVVSELAYAWHDLTALVE